MGVNLMKEFFEVKIGHCIRKLPLVKGDFFYYSFNMLGDSELNKASAKEIKKSLTDDLDVIVTIESKAIALAQELAIEFGHPRYVVIRKSKKSYMKNEVSITGNTIISGYNTYYLDGADIDYLKGKKIVVVDDVISTGGTIDAVYRLLTSAGLSVSQYACVLCEGKITTEFKGIPVVSCGFIPLDGDSYDR